MANVDGQSGGLGYTVHLQMSYEDALSRVKDELKREGFGVLSEIDIAEKLKEKVGVNFRKYVILGACNPQLAYQALEKDLSVGLLLPCNVVVYEDGNSTVASFIKPKEMLDAVENKALQPIADEADAKLHRAFGRLQS